MDQRTALLEAAITCLQERGYARTTTRDIVTTAGSHLPAVNYYFGSKEQLLHEAVVESLHRWTRSTMAVADAALPVTPHERLRAALREFFASLTTHRASVVAATEAFGQAAHADPLRQRLAEVYQQYRHDVAAALAATSPDEPGTTPDEPDADDLHTASVLLALFDGLAIQWLMDPQGTPDADAVARALTLISTAIADGE